MYQYVKRLTFYLSKYAYFNRNNQMCIFKMKSVIIKIINNENLRKNPYYVIDF